MTSYRQCSLLYLDMYPDMQLCIHAHKKYSCYINSIHECTQIHHNFRHKNDHVSLHLFICLPTYLFLPLPISQPHTYIRTHTNRHAHKNTNSKHYNKLLTHIYDTGAQTHRLSILAFSSYHILHCICFKIPLTESEYLVSNWSYTHLIRAIKTWKKKFKIFRSFVSSYILLRNNYFIILKLFRAIKGFLLYQIKQTALISGYNFTSYGKFTNTRWIEELQARKPLSPILVSSSISRKQKATGFEPLRHISSDLHNAHL